jgi:RNA polymerase sigma-70 factor, ECF subfamily
MNRQPVEGVWKDEAVANVTDEQLLAEYAKGHSECFEELVGRYSEELFHFLVRFTGGVSSAEDILQEAFLQVHLSAGSFDPSRRFKPWLFTIAANKARDMMRGRARRSEVRLDASVEEDESEGLRFSDFLADTALGPTESIETDEQRQIVRRIVEQMPEHLREALILAYYHKFPYKDMAEILQVPLGTVKSRLHGAVSAFAAAYQKATGQDARTE